MSKCVIITGTSRGIGYQIAQDCVDAGYKVIAFDRTIRPDSKWAQIRCDLLSVDEIHSAFEKAVSEHGVPFALINNAADYTAKGWDEQTLEEFERLMSINARAPFLLSRLFASELIESGKPGVIVNISSIVSVMGSTDIAYAASKAALGMISKSMAKTFAPHNIRVVTVSPGPVETDMSSRLPPERKQMYQERIPMKRFGETREISKAVVFMLSDDASFITGTDLRIDGGMI